MTQEILTYVILALTAFVAVKRAIQFFKSTETKCDACSFSAGSCKVATLNKNMKRKKSALARPAG